MNEFSSDVVWCWCEQGVASRLHEMVRVFQCFDFVVSGVRIETRIIDWNEILRKK